MNAPHYRPFSVRAAILVALSLSWGSAAGQEPNHHKQVMDAIRSELPKFDAKDSDALPVPQKESSKKDSDSASPVKSRVSSPDSPSARVEKQQDVVELPKVVIHPIPMEKSPPTHPLPRIPVQAPVKDIKVDEFMSPAERDEQLVKKHLSAFDRSFLNRYNIFGVSKEQRAREAERLEQSAVQLNHIADIIEVSQQLGIETDEDRKLREEYVKLLRTRPR